MKWRIAAGFFVWLFIWTGAAAYAQEWSLRQCLEYAATHNGQLVSELRKAAAAEFGKKSALAELIPELKGNAGMEHYWEIPVQVFPGELVNRPGEYIPVEMGMPWMGDVGVSARWDIANPAAWARIKSAKLQQQVADSRVRSLEQSLLKNVRMAYYQSQLLQENNDIAAQRLDNYQKIHALIEQKLRQGIIDKIAYNQSAGMLKNLRQNRLQLESELKKALLTLKLWMGYPLNEPLDILSEIPEPVFPETAFRKDALPDYKQEKLQVQLARNAYRASLSQIYPSLSVTSAYRRLGFGQRLDFVGNSRWFGSGYVGLQLNVPLLLFGKMFHEPKRHKRLIAAAEQDLAYYEQTQKKEFLQEKIAWETAFKVVTLREEELQLARENERLAYRKIREGIIDMIELKQIQQDMNDARSQLNDARLALMQHTVELQYLQSGSAITE